MKEVAVASEVSTLRITLRLMMAFVVMSAAFFGSAGTVAWPQAWIYMIIQFSFWTVTALWLKKHNPQLLKDRMVFLKPATRGWDKTIIMTSTAVFVPYLLLPGLDAVRYEWSSVPMLVSVFAYAGVMVSLLLFFAVLQHVKRGALVPHHGHGAQHAAEYNRQPPVDQNRRNALG